MGLLYKSWPLAVVHPTPSFSGSAQVLQCYHSNHMVGASVKLLLFQRCLACVPIKHAHTHAQSYVHILLLACVQIQTKPYGPSFSSFTSFTVRNPGAAEGQEEPATPVFAGRRAHEEEWSQVIHTGLSIWSEVSLPLCCLKTSTLHHQLYRMSKKCLKFKL